MSYLYQSGFIKKTSSTDTKATTATFISGWRGEKKWESN